jgi:hypothetical protein
MKDGGLRAIFRNKLRSFHWTSIETAGTATGVPDSEFCTPEGVQGWIEYKQTHIWYVKFQPFQVSWLDKRSRYGGRAWIAVRRVPRAKKHGNADELWLMKADQAVALEKFGLEFVSAWMWNGGEGNWNWEEIRSLLSTL